MRIRCKDPETGEDITISGIQTRLPSGLDRADLRRYIRRNGVCGILMDLAAVLQEMADDRLASLEGKAEQDRLFFRRWAEEEMLIVRDLEVIRERAEQTMTPAREPGEG